MLIPRDRYFFHYTTREAAFEFILPDRELRLSPMAAMRDPLESNPLEFGDIGGEGWESGGDPLAEKLARATAAIERMRSKIPMLCLSIDPDPIDLDPAIGQHPLEATFHRGHSSARMWENYAENHQGVCLLFDRDLLSDAIDRTFSDRPSLGTVAIAQGKVSYSLTGGAKWQRPGLNLTEDPSAADLVRYLESQQEMFFFSKTADWASEYEWRFVYFAGDEADEDHHYFDFGDSLKRVLVGGRFPPWQAAGAIEVCSAYDIVPERLTWERSGGPIPVPLDRWADMDDLVRARQREHGYVGGRATRWARERRGE